MHRYGMQSLRAFAEDLLGHAGMETDKAVCVAEGLVAADAMGHTTHGLALLPEYLDEIASGSMTRSGHPSMLHQTEAAQLWDGRRLPGLWLASKALAAATERADRLGTATVVVRRSHHLGALAAALAPHAAAKRMALIACSDPSARQVAPFGAAEPLLTPNPLAAVIPADDGPILLDISTSITTAAMTARLAGEGRRFPAPWAIDATGEPTDDPAVFTADPPGALLPIGGIDHGHKGFALGVLVEALTQGLAGHGRADAETRWGASIYVQVWNPEHYAGADAFCRQTGWLANACRASRPRRPGDAVRMPGEKALASLARARAEGVRLHPAIIPALARIAGERRVVVPSPL